MKEKIIPSLEAFVCNCNRVYIYISMFRLHLVSDFCPLIHKSYARICNRVLSLITSGVRFASSSMRAGKNVPEPLTSPRAIANSEAIVNDKTLLGHKVKSGHTRNKSMRDATYPPMAARNISPFTKTPSSGS